MNKMGWLVNDRLTCIPGTKTLWHDLLEWLPGLIDKTDGHTPFDKLSVKILNEWIRAEQKPEYIIRNGTFFDPLGIHRLPIISLIQDVMPTWSLRNQQLASARESHTIVFNSEFTKAKYPELHDKNHTVIPLGVDFEFFCNCGDLVADVLPNSVLFVGAENVYPKGFDRVMELINNTDYNFCLVMKDNFRIEHPRVRVFNKLDQAAMRRVYCSCRALICTSRMETQHLAGIEAAACGLPIIATNVGIYNAPGNWGIQVDQSGSEREVHEQFKQALKITFGETTFTPRYTMRKMGYDKQSCASHWQQLVHECTHPYN